MNYANQKTPKKQKTKKNNVFFFLNILLHSSPEKGFCSKIKTSANIKGIKDCRTKHFTCIVKIYSKDVIRICHLSRLSLVSSLLS